MTSLHFFKLHGWADICRAKDMTDPMHVNTVNDTRPSKYAGDHIQALQSQFYPSRLQMAMMVS